MLVLALLPSCGFQPVYGPRQGMASPALAGLSQVNVAVIPERSGQLLRQALQDRLERGGANGVRLYELVIGSMVINQTSLAYRQDSNPTRIRIIASAAWSLVSLDAQRKVLSNGVARSTDGFNSLDLQFFYADLASEAAQRRLAEAVADQVALQLATYFNSQPTGS